MIKKSVVILVAFIFILAIVSSQVLAQNETDIIKAYAWLGSKVKTKALWDDLDMKQHAFSLLALSCNENNVKLGNESLYGKSFKSANEMCWGKKKASALTDCTITETSLAKIAADKLTLFNTSKADTWLLNQSIFFKDIFWFLELDVERNLTAECRISYDGTNSTLTINGNKTLSNLSSTTCFSIYDNYWLSISKSCYEKSFKIRCVVSDTNKEFRATLKYKKAPNDNTWYVSPESNVSASGQEQEVALQSYCLADPTTKLCDYEGTAWAAYALKGNKETNKLIPYLIIAKEDNEKYLPESLLYLSGITQYGDELKTLQNSQGFWKAQPNTAYGQFYDTALAGITELGNLSNVRGGARYYLAVECDKTRTFIETPDKKYRYWECVETNCNDIRDTAFLLWVFWPEFCSGAGNETCSSYGFSCRETCLPDEHENASLTSTCAAGLKCCSLGIVEGCEAKGGHCLDVYNCPDGEFKITNAECGTAFETCCKEYSKAKCGEFGKVCGENEDCAINTVKDSDGVNCCPGENCFSKSGNKSCSDSSGIICYSGETCMNEDPWEESTFISANDSGKCCKGKCIEDKTCSGRGGIGACATGQTCLGKVEETTDNQYCCIGTCETTKNCSQVSGYKCSSKKECDNAGGTIKQAKDTDYCCSKQCKKKSLWWIWLLIAVVVVAIIIYFLKFRKKKKKPTTMTPGMMMPLRRPLMPLGAPMAKPTAYTFKPMPAMMPPRTAAKPISKTPIYKAPSKTETELEKTLKKLKGMTKK